MAQQSNNTPGSDLDAVQRRIKEASELLASRGNGGDCDDHVAGGPIRWIRLAPKPTSGGSKGG